MIYALMAAFLWNVLNAEWDAYRIKKHKQPNHPANAGLYLGLVIFLCFLTDWKLSIALICLRPLVFDHWLNVRRGLPLDYQPKAPKSAIDKIENALFGKSAWFISNLLYLSGFILGLIINHD
jgi:hypothetical protein